MVVNLRVASLAAILLLAGASAAPFEDVQFTTVISDDVDHVGFLDIQEIAVGEPGDGTMVFRITTGIVDPATAQGSIAFFFTSGGSNFAMGPTGAGAPYANGNINGQTPDTCEIDGSDYYCSITYDKIGALIGSQMTNTYSISYVAAAQDYGPGAGGFHNNLLGNRGSDYEFTGCTLIDPLQCPGAEAPVEVVEEVVEVLPQTHYFDIDGSFELASDNATLDTFVYNWTSEWSDVDFAFDWNVTGGSIQATLMDGEGAELLAGEFSNSFSESYQFLNASSGPWQLVLEGNNFTGSLSGAFTEVVFDESGQAVAPPESSPEAPAEEEEATPDEEVLEADEDAPVEESPGLTLVALLALVGLLAYRRR